MQNKRYPVPKLKKHWEPIASAWVVVYGVLSLAKDGRTVYGWFPRNHGGRTDAAPTDLAWHLLERRRIERPLSISIRAKEIPFFRVRRCAPPLELSCETALLMHVHVYIELRQATD